MSSKGIAANTLTTSGGRSGRTRKPEDGEVSHSVYSGILYSLALLQCPSADLIALCARGLDARPQEADPPDDRHVRVVAGGPEVRGAARPSALCQACGRQSSSFAGSDQSAMVWRDGGRD